MATDHNFKVKNGLSVGVTEIIDASGNIGAGGAADSNYDLKVYGLARFQGTTNFVSSGNVIQIGGTTVIDSNINLTNIGSITASADISLIESGDAKIISNSVGDYFPSLEIKRTSGSSKTNYHWIWQLGSSGFLNLVDNTNSYYPVIFKNNGDVALANDTDSTNPVLLLDKSAESATFAGTISSGVHTITSTGTIGTTTPGNGYLQVTDGSTTLALDPNEIYSNDDLVITTGGDFDIRNGSFSMGDEIVITSSKNIINVGTITASGEIQGGSLDINGVGDISGNVSIGSGTQTNNSDADLTIREGNAFAGFDFKSARTSGNIGGLRFYNTSSDSVPKTQFLIEVDGSYNFYSGSNGAENRLIIDSSGNVGIGNTSPTHIYLTIGSSQSDGIEFTYDSSNTYRNRIVNYWNSSTDTRMDFEIGRTGNVAPTTVMSVGYGGRVGIGTSSPSDLLHLESTSGDVRQLLNAPTDSDAEIKFAENEVVKYTIGHDAGTDSFVIGTTNVDTNKRFVIDSTGNIGINNTDPQALLHIDETNVGTPTTYGGVVYEAVDAQIDIISNSSGTWGSALNFVEGASTTANTDVWSIARKTTGGSGDSSLNFNFGPANRHDNTNRVAFSSGGVVSAAATASNSAPIYTFIGDTDTGLGYIGSNSIGLIAAGSRKFYINSTTAYFQNLTGGVEINTGVNITGNLHAGDGSNIDMDSSSNGQLEIDGNGYTGAIALNGSAMHIYHNSASRDLILGTNETARLTIGGTGTFDFNSNNLQSIASITATGLDLNGSADISGSLNMSGGHIYMNNFNIYDINTLTFNDPGPNEGISWDSGNTKIYESPDDLTTNSAGNLQFVYGSTRRMTVNSTGIDVNNTITTTYVDAETLKANDSGATPGSCKLHVGSVLSSGSSAVAQLGGFIRMSDQLIIHSGTSANTVFVKYAGGNIDLTEGEGSGANPATIVNDLRSTARGSGWEDQLNLISSDGTNKWNLLVDNGAGDILRFGYNSTKRVDISTGGNVDTTGFFEADQGFRQAIAGNDGLRVFGGNANQPLIRVSANAIGNNSADYGYTLAYRGDRSGNENSLAIYSDNQTGSQVEAINIKQDGTTHFGADVYLNSKKMFFNTTSYGVGAGGHNFNSVYVDTVESGSSTDPLELVYYQGRGVNIGSGASKNLGCAGLGVGVADNGIRSGYMAHFKSTGDVALLLEADSDNVTETDNPFIRFEQDGSLVAARIGYASGTNEFEIFNEYGSEIYFGTNNGNKAVLDTSGNWTVTGNVTAYGSVSDIRRKENIEVIPNALDKVKTLDGITFNFKEKPEERMTGVIAQQVMEVLPEAVYEHETIEKEETLAVHYGNMVGLLIEAVKDQQKQIEELKEQVSSLTPKN